MPVIRTVGTPRRTGTFNPGALVLATIIASAAQPWASQALCAQTDPDIFFSEGASEIAQAKAICSRCAVRAQCLSQALRAGEPCGIWGGLTPDERRKLMRRRNGGTPPSAGAA